MSSSHGHTICLKKKNAREKARRAVPHIGSFSGQPPSAVICPLQMRRQSLNNSQPLPHSRKPNPCGDCFCLVPPEVHTKEGFHPTAFAHAMHCTPCPTSHLSASTLSRHSAAVLHSHSIVEVHSLPLIWARVFSP